MDDLRCNATLTAMLVYAASEDPARIPLDGVDLAAQAANANNRGGGNPWPQCEKADSAIGGWDIQFSLKE